MQGRGENIDIGVGYNLTGRAEGAKSSVQSFYNNNGGNCKRMSGVGKG